MSFQILEGVGVHSNSCKTATHAATVTGKHKPDLQVLLLKPEVLSNSLG